MPVPKAIDVPNFGFSEEQIAVLHTMMNNAETDYSTIDEIVGLSELSEYPHEKIRVAVTQLCERVFLIEVQKPYGSLLAVNKLRIADMMFKYC